MAAEDRQLALSAFSWVFNVSSSVTIVFINKVLMGSRGYGFSFVMRASGAMQLSDKMVPLKDKVIYSVAANISIAALNLSLMINSVGFYQITKLLIIPFTAAVEALWLKDPLSMPQMVCTAVVLAGVAIVTVSDVTANVFGVLIAGIAVASSAMQQILCRFYLKRHGVSSHELLAVTSPIQGWSLLAIGPLVDRLVGGRWVTAFEQSVPAMVCLAASCTVAVLVNVSQFMCLGRFSAVTFQVTGHAKTVLVLIGSWLYLHEEMHTKEATGMLFAVAGMVAYGYFASQKPIKKASSNGALPQHTKAATGLASILNLDSNTLDSEPLLAPRRPDSGMR